MGTMPLPGTSDGQKLKRIRRAGQERDTNVPL